MHLPQHSPQTNKADVPFDLLKLLMVIQLIQGLHDQLTYDVSEHFDLSASMFLIFFALALIASMYRVSCTLLVSQPTQFAAETSGGS